MGKKLIGLSLSFCVRDIIKSGISIDDVECIIAGTNIKVDGDLDKVIELYREASWTDFPDEAEKLARDLFSAGKVYQPRSEGKDMHGIFLYFSDPWVEIETKGANQ
ncbi:MAG TPA: hypothetical protein PLV96_00515 [Methanoregulaceae archaeon]|nr:hypothetical protein [Methanoregulaceae archaeon]